MQRRVQRHGLTAWAGGVLAAAVLGVGAAVTWPRPPAEGSSEVSFARDMSAHHAQAVDMSVTLVKRAADPAIRLLAQDILLGQQAQIGQMQGWLMAWGRPLAGREAPMAGMDRARMGLASDGDVRQLRHLPVNTAQTRYLVLMRRHHQGGVAMAKSALTTVKRPEVRAFAERVVAAQTSEIQAIDALLGKRMAGGEAQPEMQPEMDGMTHE
ncbi:secreted protein [Deinococcus aerius]|uniref:Secreted protein n=2 Tax=Deinococcus TaxID=1298 RepID=A0A2I9D2B1_9DEIO|nr:MULTISPECIES: DUF305 domain-containing protein [Deinococcus]MBB5293946.1 uncharacterized protein (DUF305 family) [Deinococcus metallilatus]QBY07480.1 DUF305 domain-containing protein [Deinococcus metallilatus]RXJ14593.1 DUF305 domain-containing protein [Deinococcus metallilatus]TLK30713.1 DUF305 domain-containing protein [Deinococcus metallilatus]GBF04596.1 secreted protein [Deinococcus aerius]